MMFFSRPHALPRSASNAVKRGFNLIEAAIVLGVVGLVIGGIWVAASAVSENRKINQTVSGLLTISENMRHLFKGTPGGGADLSGQLGWDMGVYKGADGFTLTGTYTTTPIGLPIIDIGSGVGAFPFQFYNPDGSAINMTPSQCIKIISKLTSSFHDTSNLNEIFIVSDDTVDITTFPYMPTAANCTHIVYLYIAFNY